MSKKIIKGTIISVMLVLILICSADAAQKKVDFDPFAAEPCVPQAFTQLSARHHHQIFAHSHGVELMCNLERPEETFGKQFMRGQAGDVFTIHRHPTTGRGQVTRNNVEKSGFAGTIWTDQAGDRPFFDTQGCSINSMEAPEVSVEVVYDNHFLSPAARFDALILWKTARGKTPRRHNVKCDD